MTATVSGLTISHGNADSGGGVYNWTASRSPTTPISGNSASFGGGVYNDYSGTATLTNDTLSGNSATYDGGGIDNHGTLTAVNTTIAYNAGLCGRHGLDCEVRSITTLDNTIIALNTYQGYDTLAG